MFFHTWLVGVLNKRYSGWCWPVSRAVGYSRWWYAGQSEPSPSALYSRGSQGCYAMPVTCPAGSPPPQISGRQQQLSTKCSRTKKGQTCFHALQALQRHRAIQYIKQSLGFVVKVDWYRTCTQTWLSTLHWLKSGKCQLMLNIVTDSHTQLPQLHISSLTVKNYVEKKNIVHISN